MRYAGAKIVAAELQVGYMAGTNGAYIEIIASKLGVYVLIYKR
jgi:hypothetical protein